MKTNTIFILLSLSVLAACNWKLNARVTLDLRNVPLQTVLDSISEQASIHFEVDDSVKPLIRRATITVENEQPEKVIEDLREKEKDLDFYAIRTDIYLVSIKQKRIPNNN